MCLNGNSPLFNCGANVTRAAPLRGQRTTHERDSKQDGAASRAERHQVELGLKVKAKGLAFRGIGFERQPLCRCSRNISEGRTGPAITTGTSDRSCRSEGLI